MHVRPGIGIFACALLLLSASGGCQSSSSGPYDLEAARRARYGQRPDRSSEHTGTYAYDRDVSLPAPPDRAGQSTFGIERSTAVSSSGAIIARRMPAEIIAGRPFEYTLIITNPTDDTRFENIVVTEEPTAPLELLGSTPRGGQVAGGAIRVNLGSLAPGQSRSVQMQARTHADGTFDACATVAMVSQACETYTAVAPAIKLVQIAPRQLMVCEPMPITLRVTNTGTGVARSVRITQRLPEGLTTDEGGSTLSFDIGDLPAGQTRDVTAELKVLRTGIYQTQATATAAGELTAHADSTTHIVQPQLLTQISAPNQAYVGRPVTFDVDVANRGDGPAQDTTLMCPLPAGSRLVSAEDGGAALPDGRAVQWQLGSLSPNQSRNLQFTVMPEEITTIAATATATAYCADAASDTAYAQILGIPAILLEVVDIDDPIPVGDEVTYEITVINQGSATGRNVRIVAELEQEMQYISSEGPTPARDAGGTVAFAPLPALAPNARATWRLTVRAMGAGDVRLGLKMTEDRLTRPVVETEATNFYE